MIQCIYCKGKYELILTSKVIDLIGIQKIMLSDLAVYQCNTCGQEIYPEHTIERLQLAQEHAIKNQNQNII